MSYIGKQLRTQHDNGGRVLIKSVEASASAGIAFIDGDDDVVFNDTYDSYEWHFVNLHPGTAGKIFQFQVNSTNDAGGAYDTSPITSTTFRAYQGEDGSSAALGYRADMDETNAANYQDLSEYGSTEDDASLSGILTLYGPSSTTYVKHFIAETNDLYGGTSTANYHVAGYINDADYAIDEINFRMDSGNIDAGEILMYGVKKNV